MTDLVFVKSSNLFYKKKTGILKTFYSSFYQQPIISEFFEKDVFCFSVSRCGSTQFVKPLYSKTYQSYIWVTGNSFHNKQKLDNVSLMQYFENNGFDALKELSGWFNIIVFDVLQDKVKVINSRLGLDLLYYGTVGKDLFISTRLSALFFLIEGVAANQGVKLQQALYNYPFTRKTLLKGISMMPSASVIEFQNTQLVESKYWEFKNDFANRPLGFNQSVDLIDHALDEVIKKITLNENSVSLSLTGGWDGRLLLAYLLKNRSKDQVKLYSFGTESSEDIFVPINVSEKLGFNYLPIILDNEYLNKHFNTWASNTVLYSDSLRSIKRAHYLYTMNLMSESTNLILSGNGGSNLLKSSAYAPCNVFNRYVLELIHADNSEHVIESHFEYIKQNFPDTLEGLNIDDFKESYNWEDILALNSIKNQKLRFITYLLSDIEKKYFGSEQSSYKHLIDNYSPFFDFDFLSELMKTSFFGGFTNDGKTKAVIKNSLLYAKLLKRNNKQLAAEPTDRGFSLIDLLNPLKYPGLGYSLLKKKINSKTQSVSHYNTDGAIERFIDGKKLPYGRLVDIEKRNKEYVSNFISIQWFLEKMNHLVS